MVMVSPAVAEPDWCRSVSVVGSMPPYLLLTVSVSPVLVPLSHLTRPPLVAPRTVMPKKPADPAFQTPGAALAALRSARALGQPLHAMPSVPLDEPSAVRLYPLGLLETIVAT